MSESCCLCSKASQQACGHEMMKPLFSARSKISVRSLLGFHYRSIENVFVCFPLFGFGVSFVVAFESFALFPVRVCLLFLFLFARTFHFPHLSLCENQQNDREIKIKHEKKWGMRRTTKRSCVLYGEPPLRSTERSDLEVPPLPF